MLLPLARISHSGPMWKGAGIGERWLTVLVVISFPIASCDLFSNQTGREPSDAGELALSNLSLPDTLIHGDVLSLELTVKNFGEETSRSRAEITLDARNGEIRYRIASHTFRDTLAAGDSTLLRFQWETREYSPGSWIIEAGLEQKEGEMITGPEASLVILEPLRSDIGVVRIHLPDSIRSGDEIPVAVSLENLGQTDVMAPFAVDLLNETMKKEIGIRIVSGLERGSVTALSFLWNTSELVTGTYQIRAGHDSPDENPANNEIQVAARLFDRGEPLPALENLAVD